MKALQESEAPELNEMKLLREFEDGTRVHREPRRSHETPGSAPPLLALIDEKAWVKTPKGKVFEFDDGNWELNKYRAEATASLWCRTGGFEIVEDSSLVPVKIAVMGKPAIATYLDAIQKISREEISEILGVSEGTVGQYVSKVRRGHR